MVLLTYMSYEAMGRCHSPKRSRVIGRDSRTWAKVAVPPIIPTRRATTILETSDRIDQSMSSAMDPGQCLCVLHYRSMARGVDVNNSKYSLSGMRIMTIQERVRLFRNDRS